MTLGTLAILMDSFSGFAFPEFTRVVPVLSTGSSSGNFVIQSSSAGAKRATLSWDAQSTDDMLTARGYAETKETVTFEDDDGTSQDVVVLDFRADEVTLGVWSCQATLVEVG